MYFVGQAAGKEAGCIYSQKEGTCIFISGSPKPQDKQHPVHNRRKAQHCTAYFKPQVVVQRLAFFINAHHYIPRTREVASKFPCSILASRQITNCGRREQMGTKASIRVHLHLDSCL